MSNSSPNRNVSLRPRRRSRNSAAPSSATVDTARVPSHESRSKAAGRPPSISPIRRIAFRAWAAVLVAVFGLGFFGLTSLVLAWFQDVEGVAGPVTDLGYGALFGVILTMGLLVQLRTPERKIAGIQQAALVIPALLIGSAIASDSQNVVPALILLPTLGILLALHPAREEFLRRGSTFSPRLLAVTLLGAVLLIAYALDMGAQARDLPGPPHHVQRLSTMAAMAIAIVLAGLLTSFKTRGWRTPAWSVGTAAIVFGLASVVFPDQRGAEGREWGGVAIAGGVLFIAVAELESRRDKAKGELSSTTSLGPTTTV